jgi:hypothetical protein
MKKPFLREPLKCPYCGGELYLARTWPMEKFGCRVCEETARRLLTLGLTEKEIKSLFSM